MIRTPDQRLRVFVSSTLLEMAEERKAVRKAIEELHLIPVMFELGARPHPPRLLYQSYLQQSDIFIGLYWNSYGWTAEDMTISGLEDEYRLSDTKPRLIYIKNSDQRDPKLNDLILDIQKEGGLSYKPFRDLEELKQNVINDLASLLSERFLEQEEPAPIEKGPVFNTVPIPFHELIGRETELQTLEDLILTQKKRLINLTGMGGTGKSRLAIEIANHTFGHFRNGACFISLASIKDHTQMEGFIASSFGLTNASKHPLRETLLSYLSDKNLLLVLDNFEHVLEGAGLVSDILSRCRDIFMLVTSRSPLNLIAEHLFPLSPLALPQHRPEDLKEAMQGPATRLFIERTNSVNPNIAWNKETTRAAYSLCERLGGLPLAIELVAMRFKHSNPVSMMQGMQKSLDMLNTGARDLPDRQRSFRATVNWSYDLLTEEDKATFKTAGLFQNGWSATAMATVLDMSTDQCRESIERLIDTGLFRIRPMDDPTYRYDTLQPIKEYAQELFDKDPQATEWREKYIGYYLSEANTVDHYRFDDAQYDVWVRFMRIEYENMRNAFRIALRTGKPIDALRICNSCCSQWMFAGYQNEGIEWMNELGLYPMNDWKKYADQDIRAIAFNLLYYGAFKFYIANFQAATADLNQAREMFVHSHLEAGVGRTYIYLALTGLSNGDPDCLRYFDEATRIGKATNDNPTVFLATVLFMEFLCQTGDFEKAKEQMARAENLLIHPQPGKEFYGVDALEAIYYLVKANVCAVTNNIKDAEEAFNKSVALYEERRFKASYGFAFVGLSVIHLVRNDFDNSSRYAMLGLNKGREQGDTIVILTTLRLLTYCLIMRDPKLSFLEILYETDAFFLDLNYRSWSLESLGTKWVDEMLASKNLEYKFEPRPKRQSLDELIRTVLDHFN
jgi:predicted ATPase